MTPSELTGSGLLDRLPEIRLPRPLWIVISLGLVAGTIYLARVYGEGWVALGFALMPDLGLIAGLSRNLAKGQINPRAVPLYNALHMLVGPVVMALLAAAELISDWGFVAALAWAAHVTVDRALGYRLRTPDGYIRT